MRLLIRLHRPPHRVRSRGVRHDIHHRARKRHRPSLPSLPSPITRSHQVCMAIKQVAARLIGHDTDALFANMGQAWDHIMSDPQLRWYRPLPTSTHLTPPHQPNPQDRPRKRRHPPRLRRRQQRPLGHVRPRLTQAPLEAPRRFHPRTDRAQRHLALHLGHTHKGRSTRHPHRARARKTRARGPRAQGGVPRIRHLCGLARCISPLSLSPTKPDIAHKDTPTKKSHS